jgi:hypothetical protein
MVIVGNAHSFRFGFGVLAWQNPPLYLKENLRGISELAFEVF